jgi:hypothetical protein
MEACSDAVMAYPVIRIKEAVIFISGIGNRFLLRLIYVTPSWAILYFFISVKELQEENIER